MPSSSLSLLEGSNHIVSYRALATRGMKFYERATSATGWRGSRRISTRKRLVAGVKGITLHDPAIKTNDKLPTYKFATEQFNQLFIHCPEYRVIIWKRFGERRKSIKGGEADGGRRENVQSSTGRSEAERRGNGRDDQQDRGGSEGDGQDVGDRARSGRIGGGK